MPDLDYRLVDAFAFAPFTGNPAGVVLDAAGLTDAQMQAVARMINLAETAFVLPAPDAQSALRLRWFTPSCEVEFCGHATLAAVHALFEAGRFANAMQAAGMILPIAYSRGVITVRTEHQQRAGVQTLYWFDAPDTALRPPLVPAEAILPLLGATPADLDPRLPAASTVERDLILPFAELPTLLQLAPDMGRLADACRMHRLRGVCVTTPQSLTPSVACHSRFFVPALGIPEDPVTGSLHGPLAAYYATHGLIALADGRAAIQCAQGEPGGRQGIVRAVIHEDREPSSESAPRYHVRVGGACHTEASGTMRTPP